MLESFLNIRIQNTTANLREAECCATCHHCFVWSEFDSEREYFCNAETDRPICSSVLMDEIEYPMLDPRYDEAVDRWDKWAKENKVKPFNICG